MEIFIDNNQICDMNIFLSEDYKPMFINILKMSFNNWILTVVPSLIDFLLYEYLQTTVLNHQH